MNGCENSQLMGLSAWLRCLFVNVLTLFLIGVCPSYAGEIEFNRYNHAGELAMQSLRWADAEVEFRKALTEAKKSGGKDYRLPMALSNLADSLANQRKYSEAENLRKQFLAIKQKTTGVNSLDSGSAVFKLAQVYEPQPGRYDQAVTLFKRDIAINEKELGKESPDVMLLIAYVADSYWVHHRNSEAIVMYKRAIAGWNKACPNDEIRLGFLLSGMSQCYAKLGQFPQALSASQKSLVILNKHYAPTNGAITRGNKEQEDIIRAMQKRK